MANIRRPIVEDGIVISKVLKPAMESFVGADGKRVEALPERFVVQVVSSYKCTEKDGFENPTILDYKVTKDIFEKVKYLSKVQVMYEISNSGSQKALELTLKA